MFDTGGLLPVESLPDRTALLCSGPAMVGKEAFMTSFLAACSDDEAAVAVLTDTDAGSFLDRFDDLAPEVAVRVVDCTTELRGGRPGASDRVRYISSPADLTGIGIAVSEALDDLAADHDRVRVGLASLTTLSLYAGDKQLYQVLRALVGRTANQDGAFLATYHSGSVGETVYRNVEPLFDGRVEFREGDGVAELRLVVPPKSPTRWIRFDPAGAAEPPAPAGTGGEGGVEFEPVDSIRELIDRVESGRLTLAVCNAEAVDEDIHDYFDRLGIDVESLSVPALPDAFVVLRRDGEFVAAESLERLEAATGIESVPTPLDSSSSSELLAAARGSVFGSTAADKPFLVRLSRAFEVLGHRNGTGTLRAGFQTLSRLAGDPRTLDVYRRLAATDLDLHVYGLPDADLSLEGATVHTDETQEIADSWFVVYRGPKDAGSLVFEKREKGFKGFWSYRPELTAAADHYLEATY